MRTFPLIAIACCIWITTALAEEADFSRLASSERAQLAKCFADMLTVVKRHNLRKHLLPLLEAGCAAEMRSYKAALLPHWANESHQLSSEAFLKKQASEMKNLS